MKVFGFILLAGAVALCGYMVYTLVADIVKRVKDKKNKGG